MPHGIPQLAGPAEPSPPLAGRPCRGRRRLCLLFAAAALPAAHAGDDEHPVAVKVQKHANVIVIDVEVHVEASLDETWAVLTDYDHMASFMSNLTASQVTSREGDRLEVAQKGEKRILFMRFAFAGVKGIELVPKREIRTHLIQGDFKSYQSTTRLADAGAGRTTIVHHGRYEPTRWVPPAIGPAMIESETQRHYREVAAEIAKRRAARAVR